MPKLFFALVPIAIVLVLSEYLWRKKLIKGERARKFIHILAGVWIAFWPYYMGLDKIALLGGAMFLVLFISRIFHIFHAIYAVKRKTYGELFYAAAITLCALLAQADWIFTASILLIALADGGAAVVGRLKGVSNQYFVFGWPVLRKSVAGTAAYIAIAYIVVLIGFVLGGEMFMRDAPFVAFFFLPIGAALLENITPYGIDNLTTPLFATLLLNSLL